MMHLPPHAWRLARATKRALLLATLCIGSTVTISAQAIGLDEIAHQSGLGEPLRLVIPLLTDPSDELAGEEFAGECYRVVSPVANDLPQVQWAKVALEHRGGRALLVVSTAYPINEPMMRVAVRAGCRVAMSREYTLFFDPISIEAPTVADATSASRRAASRRAAKRCRERCTNRLLDRLQACERSRCRTRAAGRSAGGKSSPRVATAGFSQHRRFRSSAGGARRCADGCGRA